MKNLWGIVAGLACLGAGFGAGRLRPMHLSPGPGPKAAAQGPAVTIVAPDALGSPGSSATGFALPPGASFAEAMPRIAELIQRLRGMTYQDEHFDPLLRLRLVDEIERLLSRASEAELIEFITSTPFDGQLSPAFEAAYACLARISPSRAAEHWLASWSQATQPTLVIGQASWIREWVVRDAVAAERWIDAIPNETIRQMVLAEFLARIAETDPERALARIDEIEQTGHQALLAANLGRSLPSARLAAVAEQLQAQGTEPGTSAALGALLASWGQREPEVMLNWIFSQDLRLLGEETLKTALSTAALKSPESFLERIDPLLADHPALHETGGHAWWTWLSSAGKAADAVAWLGSRPEAADRLLRGLAQWNMHGWKPSEAEVSEVLAALDAVEESPSKGRFTRTLLQNLSGSVPPPVVLGYALEKLPAGSDTDSLISMTVGNWAGRGEPQAAIAWAQEHLVAGSGRFGALNLAFSSWATDDPVAATEFAFGLAEKDRNSAFSAIGGSWARTDPASVIAYLRAAPDPVAVGGLTRDTFRGLGGTRHPSRHLDSALSMPPGKLRQDSVRGLFSGWKHTDAEAAAEAIDRVPEGPLRDTAIQGADPYNKPELSVRLADRITAPALRESQLLSRGRNWLKADPAAAKQWLQNHPNLPAKVRSELLK